MLGGGEPDGTTPLSDEERDGLKQSWIATRADLDAAEFDNISKALRQRRWSKLSTEELLDDLELRKLHRAMFSDVWQWAGKYRTTEKNIGIDPQRIATEVRNLVANAAYWFQGTYMTHDESAAKFHHALVAIHPFPNGNGRHARAVADLLLASVGESPFSWGGTGLTRASEMRKAYIAALQSADTGDLKPLLEFARS